MTKGARGPDTSSWFLPALDDATRSRVTEFLREHTNNRSEYGRILAEVGGEGFEDVLEKMRKSLGLETVWLAMNGSGPLWVQGAGDQAALRDWGKLVGGGFVSPCMERSHDLAGVFLPERDDFCRSCPVGPDVNQACLVCSVRDQGRWRGALGARLASEIAGDPLLRILFASLADDLGQTLSRWQAERERAELRRQLATSQRLETVGRLAGGVAHDFNNVLTVIMASCSLVRERAGGDAELLEDLDAIEQGARSASDLVRQLLAFSRRQLLEPRDVDINELLGKTEKMLRRLIGEDIELALVTFSQPVVVHVDPSQLEQVIVNLAVNARDAMPRGGRLLLETGRVELDDDYAATHAGVEPGPYALLTVTDSGSGMDQSTMARIFEPFFTTKEQGRGSGLGLATVYGIVKQSGGFIWVYSEPGQGTTFKIYLPRVEREAAALESRREEITSLRGSESILVVEDNEPVRRLAARMLERAGYRVRQAGGKGEVLAALEHGERFDLLLTDVVLPGGSGREVAEECLRVLPRLKVLYTSGYTDNAVAHYGVIDAGVEFLHKPFSSTQLLQRVRQLLDKD